MKRSNIFVLTVVFLYIGLSGSIILLQAFSNTDNQTEIISLSNNPPNTPNIPIGPTGYGFFKILAGKEQTYTTSSVDIDSHDVAYKWDWGDGTFSDWSHTKPSGTTSFPGEYAWNEAGTYHVRVKAIDDPDGDGDVSDGNESGWSDPLAISVLSINDRFLPNTFFMRILERFPNLLNLLRFLVY